MDELETLRESQARLVSASLEDRRRIERALHDGVLQDLTALMVGLQLARGDAALEELRQQLRSTLDRARRVADDVYPSILAAQGLAAALRSAARGAGLSARIDTDGGRAAADVEAVAFFACRDLFSRLEPGAQVSVALRHGDGRLRVELFGTGDSLSPWARDLLDALHDTLVFSF